MTPQDKVTFKKLNWLIYARFGGSMLVVFLGAIVSVNLVSHFMIFFMGFSFSMSIVNENV